MVNVGLIWTDLPAGEALRFRVLWGVRTSERNTLHDVLHISAKYSETLKKLRLKHRASNLLDNIRAELGCSFLENVQLFVTHPVQRNLFMSSYDMNFLPKYSAGHTGEEG